MGRRSPDSTQSSRFSAGHARDPVSAIMRASISFLYATFLAHSEPCAGDAYCVAQKQPGHWAKIRKAVSLEAGGKGSGGGASRVSVKPCKDHAAAACSRGLQAVIGARGWLDMRSHGLVFTGQRRTTSLRVFLT